jgi:ATP-dependent DNA helicase RecG
MPAKDAAINGFLELTANTFPLSAQNVNPLIGILRKKKEKRRAENKMDKKEFNFLLKQGEGLKLEFKENFDSKSLCKELIAFANTEGGRILIGINDKGEVEGIQITNKLKSEIQDLARNCDPPVHIWLETIDGLNNLLVINVKEGINKPYRCAAGFFLRQGSNSQKLSTDKIREFFNKEGKILFDEVIHPTFNFKNGFSKAKFDFFIQRTNLSKTISDEDILRNLGVLTETGKFKNAGVLFFCEGIERFFRHAIIIDNSVNLYSRPQ